MTRTGVGTLLLCVVGLSVACSPTPSTTAHRGATSVQTPTAGSGSTSRTPTRVTVEVLPWRLPEPVGREAVLPTPGGLLIAGGLVAGDQSTAHTYQLDVGNGHVAPLPDLPIPVHDVGAAVMNGSPEVIGGGNTTEQDVVQAAPTRRGWRVSGRLPTPRSDLVAITVGHRTFVVGGYNGTTPALSDILVSTSSRGFRVFGQLILPVRYPAVACAGGALWVFGGERSGAEVDAIQRIDLRTGQVLVAAHLTRALGHASAVSLGRRILLIGGRTSASTLTAAMWWFDPVTRRLRRAGTLPTGLADSAVVAVGGTAYLVGGETPGLSDKVMRITVGG